jgi:uncharacterized delta-60 repeat protein
MARRAFSAGVAGVVGSAAVAAALAAPGQLDGSFGSAGTVRTDLGGYDAAATVAVAPTGAIVVAGVSDGKASLARYDRAGRLDPAFGVGGKVVTDITGAAAAGTIVVQADGSVVVAGQREGDLALARYSASGTPDASFDGDGVVVTDLGLQEYALALLPRAGGRLLVLASRPDGFVLARYLRDGRLDSAFGQGGITVTRMPGIDWRTAAAGRDGAIVAAGARITGTGPSQGMALAVARLRSDGRLDRTFAGDGLVITRSLPHWAGAIHVAERPDRRIVLGTHGHAGPRAGFALVRLRRDGTFDPTFGNRGIVVSGVGYGVHALALDRRGRIVTAGRTKSLKDFVVARFLPDGRRDRTFAPTVTDFGGVDTPFWLALQPDGKVVVAGSSGKYGALYGDVAIARYLTG